MQYGYRVQGFECLDPKIVSARLAFSDPTAPDYPHLNLIGLRFLYWLEAELQEDQFNISGHTPSREADTEGLHSPGERRSPHDAWPNWDVGLALKL